LSSQLNANLKLGNDTYLLFGSMEDTKAGHTEPTIRTSRNGLSSPSSDAGNFCAASIKLLDLRKADGVRLHDSLYSFKECGKRCKFCRYLYASFGDEFVQKITAQSELDKPGELAYVDAWTNNLHVGEKNKLVDKMELTVAIWEGDNVRGNRLGSRDFVVMSNGGM
jgi:hypothetical protein